MKFSIKTFVVLLSLLLSINSFAQETAETNQACDTEFALLMVKKQANESKTVTKTDKRVNILIRLAGFMWEFDEKEARQYFTEAFNIADSRFKQKGFESKRLNDSNKKGISIQIPDYRMNVIREIAKKDGKWAKRLSDKVFKDLEKDLENRKYSHQKNRENSELLGIAVENLDTSKEFSQYLFQKVMKYPLSNHWYWTLYSIAMKDISAANNLYIQLLRNYANASPKELRFLSAYPFARMRIFGIDKYQFGSTVPKNLTPNPTLQNLFLQTYFQSIKFFAANPQIVNTQKKARGYDDSVHIVSALNELEPIIVNEVPRLLQPFSEAKAQANSLMTEEMRKKMNDRQKAFDDRPKTFEGRVKSLEDKDGIGKLQDRDIIGMVFVTKKEEEFAVMESWLDKIKEENARNATILYFYFKRSKAAIKDERFGDARKFADKVSELNHRATLYFEIAKEQLEDENASLNVLQTLNDVSKMTRKAENSVAKAQVLLGLAYMYEDVEHFQALSELGEAVNVINQLKNPDIFSSYSYQQITGKTYGYYVSFETPGFNLESTFKKVSKGDFQLTLAHAESVGDKYIKTLAVLAVAKNCIENFKKEKKKVAKQKIALN